MNAHVKFYAAIRVAEDGSVTLPSAVCERLGWTPGTVLGIATQSDRVSLWSEARAEASRRAVESTFAEIQADNDYRGPPLTDEQMDEIVAAAAVERYKRSL